MGFEPAMHIRAWVPGLLRQRHECEATVSVVSSPAHMEIPDIRETERERVTGIGRGWGTEGRKENGRERGKAGH